MKKTLSTLAAAIALAASAPASAGIIDLFSTGQTKLTDTTLLDGGAYSQVSSAGGDIIKGVGAPLGYRDIGVDLITQAIGGSESSVRVAGGNFIFSNESGNGAAGMIRWDGSKAATSMADSDVDKVGLGGLVLGDMTSNFLLDIIEADAGFTFILKAWTDANNWSTVELTATAHAVPITTLIPFFAFLDCDNTIPGPVTTCAGSAGNWKPVDFGNIGALEAIIDPLGTAVNVDLRLDAVRTQVPEPGSLVLAGLGLMALSGVRRRRDVR